MEQPPTRDWEAVLRVICKPDAHNAHLIATIILVTIPPLLSSARTFPSRERADLELTKKGFSSWIKELSRNIKKVTAEERFIDLPKLFFLALLLESYLTAAINFEQLDDRTIPELKEALGTLQRLLIFMDIVLEWHTNTLSTYVPEPTAHDEDFELEDLRPEDLEYARQETETLRTLINMISEL